MKKSMATFIAVIAMVATLHAFRIFNQSSISGRILPFNGASTVWAINGHDSVKTVPSAGEGVFTFTVKPGTWNIVIVALPPYENTTLQTTVEDGKSASLGDIRLKPRMNGR